VVSATDPPGHYFGFLDRSRYFFIQVAPQLSTLLGVSKESVSKVMSAYTNHEKTVSVKWNSGRKSILTERDHRTVRRIVLKNHRTTATQVTDVNTHLEDHFYKKCLTGASQIQHP
jgi:hypothetical protein